jgi:hypothetical protein
LTAPSAGSVRAPARIARGCGRELVDATIVSSPSLVWPWHKTARLPSHAHAYPHKSRRGDAAQNLHNTRGRLCAMGTRTAALRNFGISVLLRVPVALAQASAAWLPCRGSSCGCLREACAPGLTSPHGAHTVLPRSVLPLGAPPPGLLSGLCRARPQGSYVGICIYHWARVMPGPADAWPFLPAHVRSPRTTSERLCSTPISLQTGWDKQVMLCPSFLVQATLICNVLRSNHSPVSITLCNPWC